MIDDPYPALLDDPDGDKSPLLNHSAHDTQSASRPTNAAQGRRGELRQIEYDMRPIELSYQNRRVPNLHPPFALARIINPGRKRNMLADREDLTKS